MWLKVVLQQYISSGSCIGLFFGLKASKFDIDDGTLRMDHRWIGNIWTQNVIAQHVSASFHGKFYIGIVFL